MLTTLRHLLSILLLPFLVVVVVPTWLLNSVAGDTRWSDTSLIAWLLCVGGIMLLIDFLP